MGPINITVPERIWPLPKIAAITLFPFVVWRQGHRTPALEAHERYHWDQALRWGIVPFYLVYLALLPFYGGGRNHPLERKAYEIQDSYATE